jgi:hypothetical protein
MYFSGQTLICRVSYETFILNKPSGYSGRHAVILKIEHKECRKNAENRLP